LVSARQLVIRVAPFALRLHGPKLKSLDDGCACSRRRRRSSSHISSHISSTTKSNGRHQADWAVAVVRIFPSDHDRAALPLGGWNGIGCCCMGRLLAPRRTRKKGREREPASQTASDDLQLFLARLFGNTQQLLAQTLEMTRRRRKRIQRSRVFLLHTQQWWRRFILSQS
jgi:hypothetical protein